jgi:hypothetical protein
MCILSLCHISRRIERRLSHDVGLHSRDIADKKVNSILIQDATSLQGDKNLEGSNAYGMNQWVNSKPIQERANTYPWRESCVTNKGGHSPRLYIALHASIVPLSSFPITCIPSFSGLALLSYESVQLSNVGFLLANP